MLSKISTLITGRKIRFALVGCGRISKNHFDAIKSFNKEAELIAICDIDPNALSSAHKYTNATFFNDFETMLIKSDADVIILTTPSGLHPQQAILAAKHGKHVISEKPMATSLSDGKKMVDFFKKQNTYLFVVKQNRFNSTIQLLKDAIINNRFGKIYMVNVNVFWTRPQSYYDQASWRGTWEFDGGAFMNQASHYVDLLRWLIGPIESLHAFTSTFARKIEAEDSGVVCFKWIDGTLGSMNVTMLTYPENYEGSITIIGETGTVRIGGKAANEIQKWSFLTPHPNDKLINDFNYSTESVYGFGHSLYYRNVIDFLLGSADAEIDGEEGLKSLEVIVGIYKSAKSNLPVKFPINLEDSQNFK